MKSLLKVTIAVDNASWYLPYAEVLVSKLIGKGINAVLVGPDDQLRQSDMTFYLGCIYKKTDDELGLSKLNMVVHESALPSGRGFAPIAWQILAGQQEIIMSLIDIEKGQPVDSGKIYLQAKLSLKGHELLPEWRKAQASITNDLVLQFVEANVANGTEQVGDATFFRKRTPADSELSIDMSINEQFDLLRVVDNEAYPAFFEKDEILYKLIIEKMK